MSDHCGRCFFCDYAVTLSPTDVRFRSGGGNERGVEAGTQEMHLLETSITPPILFGTGRQPEYASLARLTPRDGVESCDVSIVANTDAEGILRPRS
jgi:hypothetical protein